MVKRQPSEWEEIIANEATDKELISKIYKQLLQLNSRKINDPIKKWAKELTFFLSKPISRLLHKSDITQTQIALRTKMGDFPTELLNQHNFDTHT